MAGYLTHFGLRQAPFGSTPNPDFAYSTKEHQMAIAKIQYVVDERQGFMLLQGNNGTGKTTVSQFLMNEWRNDTSLAVANILNPSVRTQSQFLRMILEKFIPDKEAPRYRDQLWRELESYLVSNYQKKVATVLVIDEAQAISSENMGTLTHIANFQTQQWKLIQIVLLAQPDITKKLIYHPALQDRIAHGFTLNPLSFDDAIEMLRFRVERAGGHFDTMFPDMNHAIYNATKGIPRRLCMLCDNMMVNAFANKRKTMTDEDLQNALTDLHFKGWQDADPVKVAKPVTKKAGK